MDIESIKEYIKDILELVKDNLKPYLITLAIVFALASGITDYDLYGLSGFIVHYPLCLLDKLSLIIPMAIVVAVFFVVAKLEIGFRDWLIFLVGGIILLFALSSVGLHVYIPIISEISDMNKELMVKSFFVILAVYYFAFCR